MELWVLESVSFKTQNDIGIIEEVSVEKRTVAKIEIQEISNQKTEKKWRRAFIETGNNKGWMREKMGVSMFKNRSSDERS